MVAVNVRFVKMHGAGNDFIMIDDRDGAFPIMPRSIASLAARGTGIGCEGVILVQRSDVADFRMRFFNPDGSEAELCGNGARCVAAFAHEIGAVRSASMRFETMAGSIDATLVAPGSVCVRMPLPKDIRENFVNSGVPHCIVPVQDLAKTDVAREGRRIRFSDAFAPNGTNVDFVTYRSPCAAAIRTYERGVEAETGACGTGAVAAVVVGVAQHGMRFPVTVTTSLGYELVVDGAFDGRAFSSVTLTGPVARVFEGVVDVKV